MASDESCTEYLTYMQHALRNKMAVAVSSWGTDFDTMSWLDADTNCTGNCTNEPELFITNISYVSGEVPPTDDYHFGQLCASTLEGDCGDNC